MSVEKVGSSLSADNIAAIAGFWVGGGSGGEGGGGGGAAGGAASAPVFKLVPLRRKQSNASNRANSGRGYDSDASEVGAPSG